MSAKKPIPLFDVLESIDSNLSHITNLTPAQQHDIDISVKFLLSYSHNKITQNSYCREIERLMQWCLLKSNKTLKQLIRDDMDLYMKFCKKPNKSWIGTKKVARFKSLDGIRKPNPDWRPFVATLPKSKISQGDKPDIDNYELSQKSLKEIFTVTSSFFNFLIQENYAQINPVQQIRQKSKYFTKVQSQRVVRKLSELQWGYVIESAHIMAKENHIRINH